MWKTKTNVLQKLFVVNYLQKKARETKATYQSQHPLRFEDEPTEHSVDDQKDLITRNRLNTMNEDALVFKFHHQFSDLTIWAEYESIRCKLVDIDEMMGSTIKNLAIEDHIDIK